VNRDDSIYRKDLHEQDLSGLAQLCANIASSRSATRPQSDRAHVLRVEWVRFNGSPKNSKTEAEIESLKKRMLDFLAAVPAWMWAGL
jgi:hypothetical protein